MNLLCATHTLAPLGALSAQIFTGLLTCGVLRAPALHARVGAVAVRGIDGVRRGHVQAPRPEAAPGVGVRVEGHRGPLQLGPEVVEEPLGRAVQSVGVRVPPAPQHGKSQSDVESLVIIN